LPFLFETRLISFLLLQEIAMGMRMMIRAGIRAGIRMGMIREAMEMMMMEAQVMLQSHVWAI